MPSEHSTSQSQLRPGLNPAHRSTSSVTSAVDSPSTSPNHHGGKPKVQKHVVHGGRTHTRVPSTKGMHKLTKAHGNEGSQQDLKKLAKNASTTSLKKNSSHVSLKRNRSHADVRPKSSHGHTKRPASVHFEIGDQDDGWEEASSSASPALSRSVSRSAVSSTKLSADNSRPQSPSESLSRRTKESSTNGSHERSNSRHSANAITERLLQRTHSVNTTKMSLATATPTGRSPPSPEKSQTSTANGTPKTGSNEVSRFVGGSGTPSDSPFFRKSELIKANDEPKRAQSMANLSRPHHADSDSEESALAPRSRKSSHSAHSSYVPPQQSRTQQKLWLQRASSNIEPAQMGAPGVGLSGLHGGMGGTSLVGAGYDGRDPRIKLQLERTGLEYLVVRRHQDPVGQALKRLSQLPGAEKNRRIPRQNGNEGRTSYGLSQSLKSQRKDNHAHSVAGSGGAKSSLGSGSGSQEDGAGMSGNRDNGDEEGVGAVLRSMWEKSFDLSASAD